jgi:deoxyribonuclease-4
MSIAGGLHRAFDIAARAGCDCLQVFVKNQLQWSARPLRDNEIEAWNAAAARTGIGPVVAHATYLINLASPDDANWRRSIDAYLAELRRCEQLGIESLVVHPGAHMGAGESAGCRRIADALREILDRLGPARARPTLEITAGQGSCLGCRFEHLGEIIEMAGASERIAVCFDTCHALAAGYRYDTPETYAETMAALDRCAGLDRLAVFHMNDSARPLGSRVDRHAHIGAGHVGMAAFRRIVTDPRFASVPMILETPKGTDGRGRNLDRLNLARLRRLQRGAVSSRRPASRRDSASGPPPVPGACRRRRRSPAPARRS